jgi:hypothetical protein
VRESIQCEKVEWQTDLDEPSAGGGGFEGWSSEGPLMTVLVECKNFYLPSLGNVSPGLQKMRMSTNCP